MIEQDPGEGFLHDSLISFDVPEYNDSHPLALSFGSDHAGWRLLEMYIAEM